MRSAQLFPTPISRDRVRRDADNLFHLVAISGLCLVGLSVVAFAYWPGVMIDDARWQYQQSVDGAYENWHPPMMAWIWHQLMIIKPGPGPMLLLQLSLYWVGIGLVGMWLHRRGSPRLGLAATCAGWLPAPMALMGSVTKDCLMAGTLTCAVGVLLWSKTIASSKARTALVLLAIILLLFAASLRANAFLACVPLGLAASPQRLICTVPRFVLSALASIAIFFMAPWAVAAALHAEDTSPELSLIIFDLGGITEHSGVSQFPDLHVPDAVSTNHGCYDPTEWDSYSDWAQRRCPLGFTPFQALVDEGDTDPRAVWLKAIVKHPLAYAQHRFAHFNLSTWFLVSANPIPTAWTQSVDNPWNFRVRQNAALTKVDYVANATAKTPLGWPIFWIALSLAVLSACWLAGLSGIVTAIASSAFLYGTGYLVFGVATGMRYYLWAITGAALAAILALFELGKSSVRSRRRATFMAASTLCIPTAMAIAARIYL